MVVCGVKAPPLQKLKKVEKMIFEKIIELKEKGLVNLKVTPEELKQIVNRPFCDICIRDYELTRKFLENSRTQTLIAIIKEELTKELGKRKPIRISDLQKKYVFFARNKSEIYKAYAIVILKNGYIRKLCRHHLVSYLKQKKNKIAFVVNNFMVMKV